MVRKLRIDNDPEGYEAAPDGAGEKKPTHLKFYESVPGNANLLTSVALNYEDETYHTPLLDLDIEHFYVKSSSKGHAHLVLNTVIDHETYGELLTVLHKCGIISDGILNQYKRDGFTAMRMPGMKKGECDIEAA